VGTSDAACAVAFEANRPAGTPGRVLLATDASLGCVNVALASVSGPLMTKVGRNAVARDVEAVLHARYGPLVF
jgi:hypothetical protein